MSGVAKDETNPTVTSDETVSAVGDAEAGHAESLDSSETEGRGKRHVPHLRVVTDNEPEFAAPVAPSAEAPHQRIGALIRATRENRGYTLDQVSKETRVHLSHLRAIEDMTPNLLGAPVYAKGYIRAYARHLGLDENTTLDRYLKECAILKDPEKQDIAPPSTGRKLPVTVPVFGFLILALIGGGAYFLFANGEKTPAAPVVVAANPADPANPVVTPDTSILAGTTTATAPATQQLRIVALKRALLEVRSASGDKYVRRDFEPGEAYTPRVGSGWTISTSDGSAFEWRLGDKSLGLVGDQPAPVNAQSVDMAATRTPIEVAPVVPAVTDTAPAATPSTTQTPPAGTATPAPAKPKPATRPKPAVQQPPAVTSTPDVAAEAPPPVQAPKKPVQDPAQLAYPDQ